MSETTKATCRRCPRARDVETLGVEGGEPDSRNPASENPSGTANSQEDLGQAAPPPRPLFPHLEHERAGPEYS